MTFHGLAHTIADGLDKFLFALCTAVCNHCILCFIWHKYICYFFCSIRFDGFCGKTDLQTGFDLLLNRFTDRCDLHIVNDIFFLQEVFIVLYRIFLTP
ncbi:hypothetical protein D3C87_1848920 [compost metagenome]